MTRNLGLYKATEKILEKGFDAAWTPVNKTLAERVLEKEPGGSTETRVSTQKGRLVNQ